MPTSFPQTILATLSEQRLFDLARTLEVTLDGDDRAAHIAALCEAPAMHIDLLAGLLKRDELKHICEASGIHIKGRLREALVARLAAEMRAEVQAPDSVRYAGRIAVPKRGDIVQIRRRQYFVEDVRASSDQPDNDTLIALVGLDDDNQGRRLEVFWELELGARVVSDFSGSTAPVKRLDDPKIFSAYLNALRWNTVSATDPSLFQAPYRAGVRVMVHQMVALKKALELPRVNLFIADDVGLGKTIEAGLVLQELMLRQRVEFVLIVCPAALCLQWRDEMANRFGIQCEIYNRAFVSRRRQERGFGVNPWSTHTRFIISHQTLRQPEYREELLATLTDVRSHKSLLILDEAHVAAPASESRYAVDSKITKMVRDIAGRFKNRIFLSATPHNGHSNSFSALLEILDPQRFIRGLPIGGYEQLRPVMVRRLKADLKEVDSDGDYPTRRVIQLDLALNEGRWQQRANGSDPHDLGPGDEGELELARLLSDYTEKESPKRGRGRLVFINLQKRLLSSVEAFVCTLQVHTQSLQKKAYISDVDLEDDDDDDEFGPTDEALSAREQDDNAVSSAQLDVSARSALTLCQQMQRRADVLRHRPDAKVMSLLLFIRQQLCSAVGAAKPSKQDQQWSPRRIIIFTEYGDTRRYLLEQLRVALQGTHRAEERILQIYGGMNDEERAAVQRAFCGDYDEFPVRILLATDAAREGLNLQLRCADLFHFDIPWNPGRMEQRNGRIDRVLQPEAEVRCHYFLYEGRSEDRVLEVIARKVATIGAELGSQGQVVLERMGRILANGIDGEAEQALASAQVLGVGGAALQAELGGQAARDNELFREFDLAKDILNKAKEALGFRPEALRVTLNTVLETMDVGPLQAVTSEAGRVQRYTLPELPSAWQETLDSLRPARQRDQEFGEWRRTPPQQVCFYPGAQPEDGVVALHLSHPLVKRLLARLGAQGFGAHDLSRVTVVRNEGDTHTRVIALARLSLFGTGATRLHDHLVWVSSARRTPKRGQVEFKPGAEKQDTLALAHFWELMERPPRAVSKAKKGEIEQWAAADFASLWTSVQDSASANEAKARAALHSRGREEADAMRVLLTQQQEFLGRKLAQRQAQRPDFREGERLQRQQYDLDTVAMEKRWTELPQELESEPRDIEQQYRVELRRLDPVGLIYLLGADS